MVVPLYGTELYLRDCECCVTLCKKSLHLAWWVFFSSLLFVTLASSEVVIVVPSHLLSRTNLDWLFTNLYKCHCTYLLCLARAASEFDVMTRVYK